MEYRLYKPAANTLKRATPEEMMHLFAGASRAADTNVASPIMADRLSPDVMPIYVDEFPLYDVIEKEPSNGVSHTFEQQTAFSGTTVPHTVGETGTVLDDANVYLRKTTNIMTLGVRRGVTLKALFAGQQAGGPSSTLEGREIKGGLQTIARDAQAEICTFQESNLSSTSLTSIDGAFDSNGVNGLRYIMANFAPPENQAVVDVRTAWTDQRVLLAVRTICDNIWDKGGKVDLAVVSSVGRRALMQDQLSLTRIVDKTQITPGLLVSAIETDQGLLPLLPVPGNFIGKWVDATGAVYVDIHIVWTETLRLPYLGSPEPTIITVPIGTDGQLRKLTIPFQMIGFAAEAPTYMGRVSLRVA
jgi:hypothetical protein